MIAIEHSTYIYWAKVTNIVDGDTIDAIVDYGFHGSLELRFRIYQDKGFYFDTPEIKKYSGVTEAHKQHGLEAKARAKELLLDKTVILRTYKEGSFRWLAEVYYKKDDGYISYVSTMIAEDFQKKETYPDE